MWHIATFCLSAYYSTQSAYPAHLCQLLQEGLCYAEAAIGHSAPKVEVLRCLGVFERHVADDAERDERRGIEMAGLRDGTALHVDSHRLGELLEYRLHLLLRVDKPVAAHDGTLVHGRSRRAHGESLCHKLSRRGIARGQAHHLTERTVVATVHIVVNTVGTHHHLGGI